MESSNIFFYNFQVKSVMSVMASLSPNGFPAKIFGLHVVWFCLDDLVPLMTGKSCGHINWSWVWSGDSLFCLRSPAKWNIWWRLVHRQDAQHTACFSARIRQNAETWSSYFHASVFLLTDWTRIRGQIKGESLIADSPKVSCHLNKSVCFKFYFFLFRRIF